tara:strand:- start:422 stop:592 length:171 start_codon:yes stop_codon:yes gene_type:complete
MLVDFDEIVNDTVDVGVGVGVDGDVQLALIVAAAAALTTCCAAFVSVASYHFADEC